MQTQQVATAIKAKEFDKAISLRDPEFRDYLRGFFITSTLDQEKALPQEKVS